MAWHHLGWTPVAFSEVDPFACSVLAHHYPDVPNWGDMTRWREWPDEKIDLLVGGTPCFTGETLVLTKRGLIPISDVIVGDEAYTHKNRYRKVLAVGSKMADTIKLYGQGMSSGITTTSEHPFYSRLKNRVWVGRENGSYKSFLSEPEWIEAEKMVGRMWASPSIFEETFAPPFDPQGNEKCPPELNADLAWFLGRWLGDGWCRIGKRRSYVIICCGKHEIDYLTLKIRKAGLKFCCQEQEATYRIQISNSCLAKWICANFSHGAANKTIPSWVFGWNHRRELFEGYMSADGCLTPNGRRASTVSRKLSLGLVILSHALGFGASRRLVVPSRKLCTIGGRSVSEKPVWQVTTYNSSRSSVDLDGHRYGLVRKMKESGFNQVYNIEVEEDNSYVAEGIVVHNCQSYSIAGLRKGLQDPRGGLMLDFVGIAQRYKPRWVLWENVPGVLNSNGGRDFGTLLGSLENLGYKYAYRVLDAQWVRTQRFPHAVPQRRRRVFVVGYLGDDNRAAEVLFKQESCRRDITPSRRTGSRSAAPAPKGAGSGGDGPSPDDGDGGPGRGLMQSASFEPGLMSRMGHHYYEEHSPTIRAQPGDNRLHVMIEMQSGGAAPAKVGMVNMQGSKGNAVVQEDGPSYTLAAMHGHDVHAVVYEQSVGADCYNCSITGDVTMTLKAGEGNPAVNQPTVVMQGRQVQIRRVTPEECEKLQGFPAGYTAVPHKGKTASETQRYKSLGNSMAVPCMEWIAERIMLIDSGSTLVLSSGQGKAVVAEDMTHTLNATNDRQILASETVVRRLTPIECERLQGFPDDYTKVVHRGKLAADGPRYRSLGNSMAVSCMTWLGERISEVETICGSDSAVAPEATPGV